MLKMRFLRIVKQRILLVLVVMVLRGCMRKVVDVTKQQQAVFPIKGNDYYEYDLILMQKIEEDTVAVTYALTPGVGILDKRNRFITLEKSGFDNNSITGVDYYEYDLILKQKIEEDKVIVTYAITPGVGISDKQNSLITLKKSGFDNNNTCTIIRIIDDKTGYASIEMATTGLIQRKGVVENIGVHLDDTSNLYETKYSTRDKESACQFQSSRKVRYGNIEDSWRVDTVWQPKSASQEGFGSFLFYVVGVLIFETAYLVNYFNTDNHYIVVKEQQRGWNGWQPTRASMDERGSFLKIFYFLFIDFILLMQFGNAY